MRLSPTLQSPDQLFGCKIGIRFGLAVEWRHEAPYRFTRHNTAARALRGNGRAPVPRFPLEGDNRIVGDVGHYGPPLRRTSRLRGQRCQRLRAPGGASRAHAFDRGGRHNVAADLAAMGRALRGLCSIARIFFNRSRLNCCGRGSILRNATSLFGWGFFSNDFHNPCVKGR
jgi:hypothetical protein